MIAAVLAAGTATRFGSCKALAPLPDPRGQSLLREVLSALPRQLPTTVITGAYRSEVEAHVHAIPAQLRPKELSCVVNEQYDEGIASSLRCAASLALRRPDCPLLLTFCDLPYVTAADYEKLRTAFASKTLFAAFTANGEPTYGPPAIFAPNDVSQLLTLKGDQGAKRLFSPPPATISLPAAARDIDRRQELYSS